ncbi:AraC family transcriptional regulator [Dyadobacter sp. NIV53]|uniref:helix-turn-helix domain-containing protein n=1 Tax=Dyadobacter sp. NIV53 TaxID=2861765 RepID=UPI001C886AA2|nr:AraC family transcriptional regulator [Dyadobacter sp. NIV53]
MLQNHSGMVKLGKFGSLGDFSISYIGSMVRVTEHYHNCYKVVVSLDQNFDCLIDGQILYGLRGLIVNETIPHTFFAPDSNVLVNFIKTDSLYGCQLRMLLADKAYLNIGSILDPGQLTQVLPFNYAELPNEVLLPHVQVFLDSIFYVQEQLNTRAADERIRLALWFIDGNLHDTLVLKAVAVCINLSAGRTRHLFAQELGMPFSQYVLWKRIQKTIAVAIAEESKLTDVCLRFGFTDQSHFNHTFKRIFGLTPRNMIRNHRVLL